MTVGNAASLCLNSRLAGHTMLAILTLWSSDAITKPSRLL